MCGLGIGTSANTNRPVQHYAAFKADTLRPFPDAILDSIREYIGRVNVDFTGNVTGHPLPLGRSGHQAHAMRSETDVRLVATSLLIDPVRPVLLEMLPDAETRDYD